MLIREYKPEDREQFGHCLEQLQDHERIIQPNRVSSEQIGDKYWNFLMEGMTKKKGKIFVAEVSGEVVGVICVWVEHEIESDSDFLYVSDWVVLKVYRGKGIGRALMEKAQEYARQIGLNHIRLNVLINNKLAKDVYHDLGFKDYSLTLNKNIE